MSRTDRAETQTGRGMSAYAALSRLSLRPDARVIAVSDVHGSLTVLKKLLASLNFCEADTLILAGDFLEKGSENLATLRYVMSLPNARALSGNCDDLWLFTRDDAYDAYLIPTILHRDWTLREMCAEIGLEVTPDGDVARIKRALEEAFGPELDFLQSLPHIIDTQHFTFAHSGLEPAPLDRQPAALVMKNDAFLHLETRFDKRLVVGHMPVINLRAGIPDCRPLVQERRNVIALDGGMCIKDFGQINAMVIPRAGEPGFCFAHADGLPVARVREGQQASPDPFLIVWGDNAVQVLRGGEEFSLCRHISSGREMEIPNSYLRESAGAVRALDVTDYRLPVSAGQTVSVVSVWKDRYLAKADGVVGWIAGRPVPIAG